MDEELSKRGEIDSVNFYLQALSQNAPQQTFYSHQTTLSSFSNWLIDRGLENANIRPELAARFLESLLMKTEYTTSSIQGVLGTLSNYLCYTLHEDPELLKFNIIDCLRTDASTKVADFVANTRRNHREKSGWIDQVKLLISHLRNSRFGCLTHTFIEILCDTKARPELVRYIDITNLNLTQSEITVDIPETFVVSESGIVGERTSRLSSRTIEVIETYRDGERDSHQNRDRRPLLTTSQGRVSSSTLRRSIKEAVETAARYEAIQDSHRNTESEKLVSMEKELILPSDIWWYAVEERG